MADTRTLTKAREDYLLSCQIEGKAKGTLDLYGRITRKFCDSIEWKAPENVTTHDIRGFLADLDVGHVTVNIYCRTLRTYFNFLVANGYIASNPMDQIPTPRVPRVFPYVLSEDEVNELLRVSKPNPRDFAILIFLLDTGVRVSELCGLSVDDISLPTKSAVVFGKGSKERTVFFSDETAKALMRYVSCRKPKPFEESFFLNRNGDALTRSGVLQLLKRLGQKACIEDKRISPHTLRHSFATFYVKEGGDAHSLQQMLGHSSTKMAEAYVNLVGRDLAEAHRKYSPVQRLKRRGN